MSAVAVKERGRTEFARQVRDELSKLERLVRRGELESLPPFQGFAGREEEMNLVLPERMEAIDKECGVDVEGIVSELSRQASPLAEHVTGEMAVYQLETRGCVCPLGGTYLSRLEKEMHKKNSEIEKAIASLNADVALTAGSQLPTHEAKHLTRRYMRTTPDRRYEKADEFARQVRGNELHLAYDPLLEPLKLQSIMGVASACAYQVHIQTDWRQFVDLYNVAHATAAYVMAVGASSPDFAGLVGTVHEKRVNFFNQAWDTRRVFFTDRYISSPSEPFERNLSFPSVLYEPSKEMLPEGRHDFRATQLHNGLIHPWIRAVVDQNKDATDPHLRIEARYLGQWAAPHDNVANECFLQGLLFGVLEKLQSDGGGEMFQGKFPASVAKENFEHAVHDGRKARLQWIFDGKGAEKRTVVSLWPELEELSVRGLRALETSEDDIANYIGTIRARVIGEAHSVSPQMTEADWRRASLESMCREKKDAFDPQKPVPPALREQLARALRHALVNNIPVHRRALASMSLRYE